MITKSIKVTDKDGASHDIEIREWTGADLRKIREGKTEIDQDLEMLGISRKILDLLPLAELRRVHRAVGALSNVNTTPEGN